MRWVLTAVIVLILLLIGVGIGGWLWLRSPDLPQAELEARYAGSASRFADLPSHVRLHYKDEGSGPVILLIHGGGDNLWTWDGWVKTLKDHYRVIRLDLPGHGLTQIPPGGRADLDSDAGLVAAFADHLHLGKFAIAGNSLGGEVSLLFAQAHPERLNALILVDSAGLPNQPSSKKPPLAFRLIQYRWVREVLKTIDNKPLIIDSLKGEVGNPTVITDEIVDRWSELQRAPRHRDILLGGILAPKLLDEASLRKISVPTLILWGEIDPVVELASGRKFAATIPNSRLVIYPHVGHLPQIEIPQKSAEDAAKFLAGLQ